MVLVVSEHAFYFNDPSLCLAGIKIIFDLLHCIVLHCSLLPSTIAPTDGGVGNGSLLQPIAPGVAGFADELLRLRRKRAAVAEQVHGRNSGAIAAQS